MKDLKYKVITSVLLWLTVSAFLAVDSFAQDKEGFMQRLLKRFKSFSSHNHRVTQGDFLENLLLSRNFPGDIALPPDDPVFCHRRNQRNSHVRCPSWFRISSPQRRRGRREKIISFAVERTANEKILSRFAAI